MNAEEAAGMRQDGLSNTAIGHCLGRSSREIYRYLKIAEERGMTAPRGRKRKE